MTVAIVTDAWRPQTNGVVTMLSRTVECVRVLGHEVTQVWTRVQAGAREAHRRPSERRSRHGRRRGAPPRGGVATQRPRGLSKYI
jgi:hypothetical protein